MSSPLVLLPTHLPADLVLLIFPQEYIRLLHKERNIFKSANSSFEPLPVAWKQQLKGPLQPPTRSPSSPPDRRDAARANPFATGVERSSDAIVDQDGCARSAGGYVTRQQGVETLPGDTPPLSSLVTPHLYLVPSPL